MNILCLEIHRMGRNTVKITRVLNIPGREKQQTAIPVTQTVAVNDENKLVLNKEVNKIIQILKKKNKVIFTS